MSDSESIKHWLHQQYESRVNKKKHKKFKQALELIESLEARIAKFENPPCPHPERKECCGFPKACYVDNP